MHHSKSLRASWQSYKSELLLIFIGRRITKKPSCELAKHKAWVMHVRQSQFLLSGKSELLQVAYLLSDFPFTAVAFAFFNRGRI